MVKPRPRTGERCDELPTRTRRVAGGFRRTWRTGVALAMRERQSLPRSRICTTHFHRKTVRASRTGRPAIAFVRNASQKSRNCVESSPRLSRTVGALRRLDGTASRSRRHTRRSLRTPGRLPVATGRSYRARAKICRAVSKTTGDTTGSMRPSSQTPTPMF